MHGVFHAMASPWEVHLHGADEAELCRVLDAVYEEVRRIELKYSRYRADSITQRINNAHGAAVVVDTETARLLDYAAELWTSSGGRFDLTTGVLRRVWKFDRSDCLPTEGAVKALLPLVGWQRIRWTGRAITLPVGMELDFGGIGKEYAVDRALALAGALSDKPAMINGGGDLAANAPPAADTPWRIGIDTGTGAAAPSLKLTRGALATSGDAERYLYKNGVRYSHVLDPRSGYPVPDAPRSVTVLAATCSEAGAHATIALLHGAEAERYLRNAEVENWVQRDRALPAMLPL